MRSGLAERLTLAGPWGEGAAGGECLWIHGASVGEILAAEGVIEGLLERRPAAKLILSTFTVTGRETARERYGRHGERLFFALLPLDWNGLPARALGRCRPSLFILLETELWPNLLHAVSAMKCPLILVNGRISERSFARYRRMRFFWEPILREVTLLCARTGIDGERFGALGIPDSRIHITGNIKHRQRSDGPMSEKVQFWRRRLTEELDVPVLVAGSLRVMEIPILLEAFALLKKDFPDLRLILAPRHPGKADTVIFDRFDPEWKRWSSLTSGERDDFPSLTVVDTLGELSEMYSIADAAFVGGTLGNWGGHNVMEPAFHSVPVLFGPDFSSFQREGDLLVKTGGGDIAATAEEIAEKAALCLRDKEYRLRAGEKARAAADRLDGAVETVLSLIELIEETTGGPSAA